MRSERDFQREFHKNRDVRRHIARTANPYVVAKEKSISREICRFVPESEGRILEVGCGEGDMLRHIRDDLQGCSLVGMDISSDKVAFASSLGRSIHYVAGDALLLPLDEESMDLVIMRDLLHHVNWDREGAIREAVRVTRKGGWIVIIEGDGNALINRVFRLLFPVERGMKDSTEGYMKAIASDFSRAEFFRMEPVFLLRAVSFVLGWPAKPFRWLGHALYATLRQIESFIGVFLPQRKWTYMFLAMQRD